MGKEFFEAKNTKQLCEILGVSDAEAGVMLRSARLKEELTQKQLAEKLGIPQGHISAMEHGKKAIGKKTARRLSEILNISYKVFV